MLFLPFQELKVKQDLKEVKDNNIGMGLTCSKTLVTELEGDISVKKSEEGLTIIRFELPVEVVKATGFDDSIGKKKQDF